MPNELLIIIPAYNEEKNIASVIRGIKKHFKNSADILVINDCSQDRTPEIVKDSGVLTIDLFIRLKYGAVLQTGFKYALEHTYSTIATIDGDGQHDPFYLTLMVPEIKQNKSDLVIGSRFVKETGYRMPLFRKFGSSLFSMIIRLLSGTTVKDPTSGYQVFNRKVLQFYCLDDYPMDYPDADILLKLIYNDVRIKEIPVKMSSNPDSSMHSGLSVIYYAFKMFLSIFITFLLSYKKRK